MTHGRRKNRNKRKWVDYAQADAKGKLAAVLGQPPDSCPYRARPLMEAWLRGYNAELEHQRIRAQLERKQAELPNENYKGHFR